MFSDTNLPWIESPFFEAEFSASTLSDEDKEFVRFFHDNGYAIINPKVDNETIDNAVKSLEPHFAKIKGEDKRIQDAWKFNSYVRQVASSGVIMDKLRLLYRREPLPFQTLSFPVGTEQRTHSDMIHFNSIPERFMCGVWVAFEDITNDNGPLHYYPGSHKLPFYDMLDMCVKASDSIEMKKAMMAYVGNYENFIQEMIEALKLKKAVLNIKKGQALIWSANLLHGGDKINTPGASRHSQVTHYYFENCMYYCPRISDVAINKVHIKNLVNVKTGEKIVSTYFGKVIRQSPKIYLREQTVNLLSQVSHFFPKTMVNKVKSLIVR